MRLGIIGYGGIASVLLDVLARELTAPLERLAVLAKPEGAGRARALLARHAVPVAVPASVHASQRSFLDETLDLVVECAGHEAVALHGEAVLAAGADLVLASIGALADDDLRARLGAAAAAHDSRLTLVPGAVGGLDILAAAQLSGLEEVVYVSRKPPAAWAGTHAEARLDPAAREPVVIFEGTAREGALTYPNNANVAATIALFGLGFERTRVRLMADPTVSGNVHEVSFRSAAVDVRIRIEGRPVPDNPKSSLTTAHSLARTVLGRIAREEAD